MGQADPGAAQTSPGTLPQRPATAAREEGSPEEAMGGLLQPARVRAQEASAVGDPQDRTAKEPPPPPRGLCPLGDGHPAAAGNPAADHRPSARQPAAPRSGGRPTADQ